MAPELERFMTTSIQKKRLVGVLLFLAILALFFAFNRFPKLDAVGTDVGLVTGPTVQCFQGFCIERDQGTSFLTKWFVFSVSYLRLVTVGMTFAFVVAGLTEAFLFPSGSGRAFESGSLFKRTVRGLAAGPVMNLCSACIVPVSSAFRRRGGGIEGAIAMVQGSATLNIPALAMVFFVFTPVLGASRLVMALMGAVLIGPLVVMALRGRQRDDDVPQAWSYDPESEPREWGPAMREAFRDWARVSVGYLVRMGPIMVIAGFASGLVIQWVSPDTVSSYLGNDMGGVLIAATFGLLINVPLLFEIPLVALLLILGMGTAPAAALLFTAAAGGPVTFWGLAKVIPLRGITAFAASTWLVGVVGGLAVLGVGALIWQDVEASALRAAPSPAEKSSASAQRGVPRGGRNYFEDVTEASGTEFRHRAFGEETLPMGGGVVVFDYDGDGLDDIYVTNSTSRNALFRNIGDGKFVDTAEAAGVTDGSGRANGGCAADYDNDGDRDLYVTNYGDSKLFRNNGDGTFANVTEEAGLGESGERYRSTGCAWADYDGDGDLDFIVLRYLYEMSAQALIDATFIDSVERLALNRNNGDGTFTNVTHILGDTAPPDPEVYKNPQVDMTGKLVAPIGNVWGAGFQAGWLDFDNDGDLDLYAVNDWGVNAQPNVLWRNDGPDGAGSWTFTDVSVASGANHAMHGMGLAVGDYDLDGFLDMYVTNIGNNVLLRNTGDGLTFTDEAIDAGVAVGILGNSERVTWGTSFFDFDNDGYEDLYVVSGYLSLPITEAFEIYKKEQANVLLRNNGDGTFANISEVSGAADPGTGRGGVFLDYNGDGCLDIFVANLDQKSRLFENACRSGNSWLQVLTVGSSGNRDGIGARLVLEAGGKTQIREIRAGSSQMGQDMAAAHFGLGRAEMIDSLTVTWPGGKVQTLTDVPINQRMTVTEPE